MIKNILIILLVINTILLYSAVRLFNYQMWTDAYNWNNKETEIICMNKLPVNKWKLKCYRSKEFYYTTFDTYSAPILKLLNKVL